MSELGNTRALACWLRRLAATGFQAEMDENSGKGEKFATAGAPSPTREARVLPRVLTRGSYRNHALTLDFVRHKKLQILDEGIDLAQIFAPALLRFQFAFPDEDRQIAELM
jgi:hypothetical protein